MISMASRDAFGGFSFATFNAKNIPVVVAVMIIPSLIKSSMFFFQSKLPILLNIVLKHMTPFWWFILFFIELFFICSLRSVICKKYANANGKDSKYTNSIDVSTTGGSVDPFCCLLLHHLKDFLPTYLYVFPAYASCLSTSSVFSNFVRCFVHVYFKVQWKKVKTYIDPIFEHPVFDSTRERVKCVIKQYEKPQEALEKSLYTCFKCGSSNIFSIAKQVRSADEGTSGFNKCRDCHNKWRYGWQL